MVSETGNALSQRGGIPLRDYTQDGRALKGSRISMTKVNFEGIAHALVFVSLGLGLMEVIMPKQLQKWVGIRKGDYSWLIRIAGLREITQAMLIFMQARPLTGVWSRVAGDAMDLGILGAAFTAPRVKKNRVAVATASVAGIAALDALTAAQLNRRRAEAKGNSSLTQADIDGRLPGGGFRVVRSIRINSSPEALYQFWHNFENLPRFMVHLQEVQVLDDRRSHWVTKAPAGTHVSWDAEITDDRPNDLIAWQSLPGADVQNSGIVRFRPAQGHPGTIVRVEIEYHPPAGMIGKIVSKLFGEAPGTQVADDLSRFKQVIETGEVLRSDGSPEGYGQKMQRPAQPLLDSEMEKISNSMPEQFRQRQERRG